MQRHTTSPRTRLRPGLRRGLTRASALPAALLTASSLLLAAAPASVAQSGGWEHYEIGEPRVITLNFDTDLLAWDLCWSDHTAMARTQVANAAVAQMNDPARLYVIDMPGLPPFYRRTSNAPIWYDLVGEQITSNNVLPNRWNYHLDVEQALIDIAAQIREHRPGAKLAFKNFEVQPLHNRPAAYTELGEVQDFYITDRTIYLNHVGHMLNHALNSAFYRARVDFANEANNWLVFPDSGGKFALASNSGLDWPPAEFEPEILALWGGDGDLPENDGGGDEVPVETGLILTPGSGFSEDWGSFVTSVGAEGMPGYDAKSIARWNVVPYQTIEDEPFSVGVVAFHINEIDRVEFYLEGGPAVTTTEMRHNPRTDTWEYWAVLDPDVFQQLNYPDGPIELRAVAYPKFAGQPRELEPLILNTNANGTLPKPVMWCAPWGSDETGDGSQENPYRQPYKAMQAAGSLGGDHGADGSVIYLMPGEYHWGGAGWPPSTTHRWATIQSAPGASASEVVFRTSSSAGFKSPRIAVKNISFYKVGANTATGGDFSLWLSGCIFFGDGRASNYKPFTSSLYSGGVYVTNSSVSDARDGFVGAQLIRKSHIENIGSDAFTGSRMVVDSTVNGIDHSGTSFHPDVFQWHISQDADNYIVYGMRAIDCNAQGFFARAATGTSGTLSNVAIVNSMIVRPLGSNPNAPGFSQWMINGNHILIKNVSLPNSVFVWRASDLRNVSVRGSMFHMMRVADGDYGTSHVDSEWFRDNHYANTFSEGAYSQGTGCTVGDPRFVDFDSGDFTPLPNSPLRLRLSEALVPADIHGEERSAPDTIGAIR